MKKTNAIYESKNIYKTKELINNTAYIESITGKVGLLNTKTGKLIGDLDDFYTFYSYSEQFYIQKKVIEDPSKNKDHNSILRFYDAKEDRLIADGWKLIKSFKEPYVLCSVESPVDGKKHIFDIDLCRSNMNIFDKGFDDVNLLYNYYNVYCLVVTLNGKKGVYCNGRGLIIPIEFDEIEKETNVIILTKNGKKYFVWDIKNEKTSNGFDEIKLDGSIRFDEIKLDEKKENIVYCKSGSTIFVYNTESKELLLKLDCEDIKFVVNSGNTYFFVFKSNNKYGIISVEMAPLIRKQNEQKLEPKVTILLQANYDEINYDMIFYLKKKEKIGLFQSGYGYGDIYIEPKYDKICSLSASFYAFYTGEYCDISKISSPLEPLITKCKIVEKLDCRLIFERNNSYGLLELSNGCSHYNKNIVFDNYDNIEYLQEWYFKLENNGKKGVSCLDKVIIPVEYDEIEFHYNKTLNKKNIYFALEKAKQGFELAKIYGDSEVKFISDHTFTEIKFFKDIMVLKDETNCYIYDYNEEKILKTLPENAEITMVVSGSRCCDKKILYCIDGMYYFYQNGKFEEAYMEDCELHVTTYESDSGVVVVNSYDKAKHDEICKQIEEDGEESFDRTLVAIYEKNPRIQKKYPTLIKRMSSSTK